MHVRDASFVVVDTETTGGRANGDRVIEIGAAKVCGGRIIDRFQELINPQCAVPRRIARLTGISTAMVFDRPAACDVLPDFCDFLGDAVFVAHHATFDVRSLNAELGRMRRSRLSNETLCTMRLARRLLPGLRSKGLDSVCDFYGIRIKRRHRALEDADAAAEVLLRFLDQLDLEYDIRDVADVLNFQHRRYGALSRLSRQVRRLREEVLSAVPARPGVYYMKDGSGRVLYIGKARNLSSRVRTYFTAVEGHPHRIRNMVRSVREIEWEVTASELDALLLESRLIKEHQPPFNSASKEYVNRPFVRIDTNHAYPRASTSAFLHDDGAEYYGPLPNREEASFLVDVIDRFFKLRMCDDATLAKGRRCVYASLVQCTAPCDSETGRSAHRVELERVRAFLTGRDRSVLGRTEDAMKEAAAGLDFEQAAVFRDWNRRLERLLSKQESVASRVLDHNAVIVHRPSTGSIRLLVVCGGRHVDTLVPEDGRPALLESLERHLGGSHRRPAVYREREVDEVYLLSHWLYVHRNEVRQVRWNAKDTPASILQKVEQVLENDLVGALNVGES